MEDERKARKSVEMPKKAKRKRNRAYRRYQNKRIIQKRLNILTQCWGYGTNEYGALREQEKPGLLKKWNFTCNCGMHKMDRYYGRRDKRKRENLRGVSEKDYDDAHMEAWDNFHGDSVFD